MNIGRVSRTNKNPSISTWIKSLTFGVHITRPRLSLIS
ncbi:hypothetical protein AB995_1518 [Lactococcus cremoris]|nr:hypothetical protein AB995_1518 [Lactococcus cremoris]KZK36342.1 hypothetical protein LMG6897_1971 [Lactococcus cremoris]